MKKSILPLLIILLLMPLFNCRMKTKQHLASSETLNVDNAVSLLTGQFSQTAKTDRPWRLGILPLLPTQDRYSENNDFGEYFAEKLISAFRQESGNFKLFERSRLDLILKENALSLSGLIKKEQVRKLGELAPIDVIISGTYTRLKKYVDISSRLIDVVSGEILSSFNASIILNEELATLFPEPVIDHEAVPETKTDICQKQYREIELLLNDLTSPEKIQKIVDKAVKIPFDLNCGKIHFSVISNFKRYSIYPQKYYSFLLKSLASIEYPAEDYRASDIINYFASDGSIDETEWNTGLQSVIKVHGNYLNTHIGNLFYYSDSLTADLPTTYKRIDEYFNLAQNNKIGLPVPVTFETAFFELMNSLSPFHSDYRATNPALIYIYEKYNHKISAENLPEIYSYLKNIYLKEPEEQIKNHLLTWISNHFARREAGEDLSEDMLEFAKILKDPDNLSRGKTIEGHFQEYIKLNRATFAQTLPIVEYDSQRKDRIIFCLKNHIPCPGFVPTVEECMEKISIRDYNTQIEYAEYLELMGQSAQPAEATVLKMIRRVDREIYPGSTNILWHFINILGNIKTKNPKAIELLIGFLDSRRYEVPEKAITALTNIGDPAIPYILKAIDEKEDYVKIRLINILANIGNTSQEITIKLRNLYKLTRNDWVKDVIEDALEKLH